MTRSLAKFAKHSITATAALLVLVAASDGAQALCVAQDLNGTFHNINSATRGVTRVRLTFPCYDTGRRTGPVVWVQVWGKCHPRDCYWGRVRGTARWNNTLHQYIQVQARFRPSFAVKTVIVRRATRRVARLWHHTHFTDRSGRRDYSMWETMRK